MLGEWTGYAPVFKDGNSGLDLSNSRESNIKYQGSGQMGQIMLDFQWNCMIEQQGWQKVALPAYDQPLWRGNGSWFEPPTIRGVASIVFEIVGQASSQTWFSYADDVIFAAIDLGGGFKSPEQVGLDLAKTAATAVISMGCSSAGSAIGNIAGKAMEGAGKFANFAAQAGISAATSYVSTVATSAVSSVYIGADGNLAFDGEGFGKSTYSASTIAGALGAGFTAGLNEIALGTRYDKVKDPDTGKMKKEYTHTRATGLSSVNAANIQALNGLAGGLLTNAIEYAVDGQTTFNLLNSSLFGVGSVGMLEFTIGKEGVKSKFGMGGTNISVNNLINSMIGAKDWNTSEKITKYAEGMDSLSADDKKKLANALRANYGFGDKKQLENLDEILKGETELRKDGTDGKAQTIVDADSHKTIMMALSEGMDWKELGLLIGHEAFRDGIVSDEQTQKEETREAVKSHTEMAEKMLGDVLYASSMKQLIDNNQNLQMDLLARALGEDFFNAYVDGTYDSSADYWKFTKDGNIIWDGKDDLFDEDGNLLHKYSGNGTVHTDALAEALGITYAEARDMLIAANFKWENGTFVDENGNDVKNQDTKAVITGDEIKVRYDFQYNYADKVWDEFGGSMEVALSAYYANYSLGNGVISYESLKSLDLVAGFSEYAKNYDNYMISNYSEKLNLQYNSKDAKLAFSEINRMIGTKNFDSNNPVYNALGEGGILSPFGFENALITTFGYYDDNSQHGWGDPRGFAVDLVNGYEGNAVYSNINAYLYDNSINTNNPINLGTGNEIRLFGNHNSIIYGHLKDNSISTSMLKNLSISAKENKVWRTYIPAGTQIGNVGNTGNSSGPHLHWEYRKKYQFWNNRSN